MQPDMTNPVPDVCEAVKYNGSLWRVTGWYCLHKNSSSITDGELAEMHNETPRTISEEVIDEILREDPTAMSHKLVPCTREEATVIDIYAVCGALVRIHNVERIGKYVEWSDEWIKEHHDSAMDRGSDPQRRYNGLGRGHRDTLERLFPEQDFTYR